MKKVTKRIVTLAGSTALASAMLFAPAHAQGTVAVPANTVLSFGGYIKADFIYDFDETQGDTLFPGATPTVDANNDGIVDTDVDGGFRFHVRQTRLNIKSVTQTGIGEVTGFVEWDLFGGIGNQAVSNSEHFRLRHAYIKVGGWTVGQTWSLFMPLASYPGTVDFQGPNGILFVRQPQIRYTHEVNPNFKIAASLENPETLDGNTRNNTEDAPVLVLAAQGSGPWGSLDGGVMVRDIEDATGVVPGSETGWGVFVGGIFNVWTGGTVNLNAFHGEGIGRWAVSGIAPDFSTDTLGNLVAVEATGVNIGVTQALSPTVRAALQYGYTEIDQEAGMALNTIESSETVHASLFWSPTARMTVGAEVSWVENEDFRGLSDDATRLQTSVQFNF